MGGREDEDGGQGWRGREGLGCKGGGEGEERIFSGGGTSVFREEEDGRK